MSRPKISVVTAVKNAVGPLRRTLESVASQTWPHVEHLVVDGGSGDGTAELLRGQMERGRVTWWCSEPDGGIYEAMNKGVRQACGEWLLFLGAGDTLADETVLAKLAPILATLPEDREIVYGRVTHRPESDAISNACWEEMCPRVRYGDDSIHHQGVLHRRTIFRQFGLYDETFRIAADQLLLRRYLRDHDPVFVDLVIANQPLDGISADPRRDVLFAEERLRVVQLTPPCGGRRHRRLVIERRRAIYWLLKYRKSWLLRMAYKTAWFLRHPRRTLRDGFPKPLS